MAPSSANFWRTAGWLSTAAVAAPSVSTIALGVPARTRDRAWCRRRRAWRRPRRGRHIGQLGHALVADDDQGAQLARLQMRQRARELVDIGIDLPGQHVVQADARAAIGHW